MPPGQIVGSIGGDDEQPGNRRPRGEIRDQVSCRRICPMQVLDDEHRRRALGERGECTGERLRRALGGIAGQADQRRQPVEDVTHRRVRSTTLGQVEARTDEHLHASGTGPGGELADETGLADPCIAADQHRRRPALHDAVERVRELRQLLAPPDEPWTRHSVSHADLSAAARPGAAAENTIRAGARPPADESAAVSRRRCRTRRRLRRRPR